MMPLSALYRLIFVLLVGLACGPALAQQLDATYEGMLVPETFDTPIPITIQLKEQGGRLTGTLTAGSPYSATAPISSGENRYGQCNVRIVLSPSITLRLFGSCLPRMFEGRYTVNAPRDESKPRGMFRLMRKEVKANGEEKGFARLPTPSSSSLTDCIKANTRCLLACPQGDYNTEFLCSNRCHRKYQACKANFSAVPSLRKLDSVAPSDAGAPSTFPR